MTGHAVGIDLGTTNSAIAVVSGGQPHLVAAGEGVLLPSVVSFPPDATPLVGAAALRRWKAAPDQTVRSAKRLMGTPHRYQIGGHGYQPEDIGGLVIGALLDGFEREEGYRPRQAVITVPAYFTQAQRAATRAAGERAGLTVLRIVNEPTAAALAYALVDRSSETRRTLVYDLGGGTFDVSLVERTGDVVEVRASHGDVRLGGDDFDRALLDQLLGELAQERPALHAAVEGSTAARARLLEALEAAKVELSEALEVRLSLPFLAELDGEPQHLDRPLRREQLEDAIESLLRRTTQSIDEVLSAAGVRAADVDDLLLVGGSSRIPRVWALLHERYGLSGVAALPPDEAVALGAAVQAALLEGREVAGVLVDVAAHSLSVSYVTPDHSHLACQVVTPRNAPLPGRHSYRFYTTSRNQSAVQMWVFQGASANPLRNTILGEVRLDGVPPPPDGGDRRPFELQIDYDTDGIVTSTLRDAISGRSHSVALAVDGDEVEALRVALLQRLDDARLTPGLPEEEREGPGEELGDLQHALDMSDLADESFTVMPSIGIEEVCETFDQVEARMAQIRKEHPRRAERLEPMVARARALLADKPSSADDELEQLYDDVSMELFEMGIYL